MVPVKPKRVCGAVQDSTDTKGQLQEPLSLDPVSVLSEVLNLST